ncbi:hypothetical protein HMPREF9318_00957 [Streptococcus urinalis FB127-CNA-2]|uniref:Acetyltransferase, GNAT family n=1 Tax=Streptococcus urinalis 2285-97 TaxID=764291 RepID=G5KGU1_9STRE|nr:GNAT family N-acetyltransferase [Streptococcus urinalis]EHJ55602.1 acetyltransferase, GNAT family [Streptococcus urinalis 2285-97]EKS21003.1 hypothetical protein HMPREF9318_00957 [Streptococcus urinalis FB127-CNA-2]VEF31012.1 Acetyltransferase (GNAT) family [Streptococcus urinalis]
MISILFDKTNQRAIALDDNKEIGECTFIANNGIWTINHTIVDSNYQGQGIARRLVDQVVSQARLNQIKVSATCSYAQKLFEKDETYTDILAN